MNHTDPGVSVIIPSIGRAELARAIASVRAQDYSGEIEVIVVGDLPQGALDPALLEGADLTLYTGGGRRAGCARNLGIARASHQFIALLDDDDEWLPQKLSKQMPVFHQHNVDIVGTQARYLNSRTGTTSAPIPTEVKPKSKSYAEYLFLNRRAAVGRPAIFGITLVVRTELARRVRWDETLRRHQDWDWVDRMERAGGRIVQIPDPSAVVRVGSDGSVTSNSDWASSLSWAESRRGLWRDDILADFIAGQVLRYALQARSLKGVKAAISALIRGRRAPSLSTWLLGCTGFVPRTVINKLMVK